MGMRRSGMAVVPKGLYWFFWGLRQMASGFKFMFGWIFWPFWALGKFVAKVINRARLRSGELMSASIGKIQD